MVNPGAMERSSWRSLAVRVQPDSVEMCSLRCVAPSPRSRPSCALDSVHRTPVVRQRPATVQAVEGAVCRGTLGYAVRARSSCLLPQRRCKSVSRILSEEVDAVQVSGRGRAEIKQRQFPGPSSAGIAATNE